MSGNSADGMDLDAHAWVTGSGYEPGDEPHRLSDDAEELAEEAGAIGPEDEPEAPQQP